MKNTFSEFENALSVAGLRISLDCRVSKDELIIEGLVMGKDGEVAVKVDEKGKHNRVVASGKDLPSLIADGWKALSSGEIYLKPGKEYTHKIIFTLPKGVIVVEKLELTKEEIDKLSN